MQASTQPDIKALHKAIDQCLLKDQFPARRSVRQIQQRIDQQQSIDQPLQRLLKRIETSQAARARRSQPITLSYPQNLPVSERREDILALIREHQVVVIAGETGSGKTTQLPKLCLEAGLGQAGRIAHTQPRRLAARSVAARIAEEINTPLGDLVGYQIRFTDNSSDDTRIKLMTDGILLAQTQHDRFLNEYDAIIIDEAHERSLNIDFLIGYLKQLLPKRPDLKVIITSATIDVERFSKHFDNAPVVEVSGRSYPVEMRYRPLVREDQEAEDQSLFEGIDAALAELRGEDKKNGQPGDVLVFLPGEREIRECAEYLRRQSLPATDILPLYARLSAADQQRIFRPHGGRRVVLSTNVAETSLTVPGIRYVIDSGVARISRYSYRSKVQRLQIEAISQASANQRAGRCGRTAPGVCIRLYEQADFEARPEFTDPEIRRTNLAAVVLQMLHLKLGKLQSFPFVDAPDERFVRDGFNLLSELEAVDEQHQLTDIGRQMARLPLDPRVSRMLLEAQRQQSLSEVLIIAAALSVQDPRERPPEKKQAADEKHRLWRHDDSDFLTLVNLWQGYEEQRQALSQNQLRKWCQKHYLSFMRLREWRDTHRQLHILCKELSLNENGEPADYASVHKALLAGMLSQIGFKAEGSEYLGARNRKLMIFPASGLYKKRPKWIMAAELMETSRLYAREVALVEPQWIEEIGRPLLKYQYFEPYWHQKRGQVVAFEQSSLYGLVVNPKKRVDYSKTHAPEARTLFIQQALVEQQLGSRVDFYQHNIELIREVTEYEEKSRRRDLVIDDAVLAAFYDQHLPTHIASRRQLESWCKKHPQQQQALKLTRDFLLSPDAAGIGVADFPTELEWNGLMFPLKYSFAPGAVDDGISLQVPLAMLQQVPAARIDWLVPGFIHDKVAQLIKGLPKAKRKQFVPVPQTADVFLRQQVFAQGDLLSCLLDYLNRNASMRVERQELSAAELPPHLQMNIQVMEDGELFEQGRDLAALQQAFSDVSQSQVQNLAHADFQRAGIERWDFGDLPAMVETDLNGLPVRAFPCLKCGDKELSLTVEADQALAEQQHRAGVVLLYRRMFAAQAKVIRADLQKAVGSRWLQAKGMGTQQTLAESLLAAVFRQVFVPHDQPAPYAEADFVERQQRRDQLLVQGALMIEQFDQWMTLRHGILKSMSGAVSLDRAMAYSDVKARLEQLLAPGFMEQTPWQYLQCFTRYLKAMAYRLDKLQGNLPRDRQAMLEFDTLEQPYLELVAGQDIPPLSELAEFGWLLQEWRVSLFAQPLGTREPVSLKRLKAKWEGLDKSLHA
ncbi:ATP-dependent RNA helicase HrpA [Bacterioplanes sanyensis]|uniref:ATP-dependent RNA helicase HrpA n=1 Tax=Bacterioplanes sanyensis TaxID=1249553 RepID=A0A222FKZ5_9GAMM|nr:ATP-dependent RNA helicase HrpA [Bacterioplanes sanyensis]ASP39707.1 ATP-dependent RNA helicase HrpA [Bacterioplanes sanyensis]